MDSLRRALVALQERQSIGEDLLKHHLTTAQEQLTAAHSRLETIEARIDRILVALDAASAPETLEKSEHQGSLEQKLDHLERLIPPPCD